MFLICVSLSRVPHCDRMVIIIFERIGWEVQNFVDILYAHKCKGISTSLICWVCCYWDKFLIFLWAKCFINVLEQLNLSQNMIFMMNLSNIHCNLLFISDLI